MSVNTSGDNNAWKPENQKSAAGGASSAGGLLGLVNLLGEASSTSAIRAVPEMTTVKEELQKIFKSRREDKMSTLKANIVPNIDEIDTNISPILPGLVLSLKMDNVIYVAPFLFYTNKIIVDVEEVIMNGPNNNQSRVNVPRSPASFIDKRLNNELVRRFRTSYGDHIVVQQLAGGVVNLESYADIRHDEKRLIERLVNRLDREWESGIFTNVIKDISKTDNVQMPSPFHSKRPYGANGTADARITPIATPVLGEDGVILPSNMEVAVVTTNPQGYNNGYNANNDQDTTPREVCRAYANVTLLPVNHQEYINGIRRNNMNTQGMGGPMNDGYRPFRPCITLNSAIAGAQLNSNGGIVPFFMGLFVLMCSNNKFAYADVLRRLKCGVRGSLINLEPRLDKMFHDNNMPRVLGQNSSKLDNSSITDIDFVNRWIQQHIMQQAIFAIPMLPAGANSSLTKLLMDLSNPLTAVEATKAVVTALDGIAGNSAFSKAAAANANAGKGWHTGMKIYHTTAQLIIDGTARFNGELFNLGELDEQSVHTFAGPKGGQNAEMFLRTLYTQENRENMKSRQQRLRMMLTENLHLTDINVNGFGRMGVMDPQFMQVLGTVLSTIGTLNTSSIRDNFMNTNAIFAPGVNLAVDYIVGVNSNQQGDTWNDAYSTM